MYDKLKANIILKALPLKSGIRQGCTLLPLTLNTAVEVLTTAIREEKKIKSVYIGRGRGETVITHR